MFPTSSRSRQKQWESKPAPGVDSCFGVRSLNGSVEWEGVESRHPGDLVLMLGEDDHTRDEELDANLAVSEDGDGNSNIPSHEPESPPSPIDTLWPTTPPPVPRLTADLLFSSHFQNLYLENTSTPSSPVSIASGPSNIASLSSLSRMSSPVSGIESIYQTRRSVRDGEEGMDDLVLPSMRLPSSSLYREMEMARDRSGGVGVVGGVLKVGVVGGGEVLVGFMARLRESEVLIDVEGGMGVVRGGEVVAVLMGLGIEEARTRVMTAYETLHGLLNPETPSSGQVKGLVESYADKEDWIHLVIALEGAPEEILSLASLLPVVSARTGDTALYNLETTPIITPSPPHLDDPTPMPSLHADHYFSPRTRSPSPAPSDISQTISLLHRALTGTESIKQASINHFLHWRPSPPVLMAVPNLSSSESSLASKTSSGMEPNKPMPTVARAQGGKEWEATLSRRIARTRRGVVRRSKACPTPGFGPLFPGDGSRGVSSVGLGAFRDGGRKLFGASGFWGGWGFVSVAAIVVAVGLGCWAKFR